MAEVTATSGINGSLARAARWCGAQLQGADGAFRGVCSDSRQVLPGNLFVALQGPNHDAHAYVESVYQAGAAAALVSRPVDCPLPQLLVEDTRLALGRLAAGWRHHLATPVVAITGSNGKTTVKEMTAAVLAQAGSVLATHGNLNNDIGVPLTLLSIDESHRFAVVEMGANHPGEIAYLSELVRPQVAVLTNAGAAHLEGFGSLDGVARAKGEIFSGLADHGVAVINAEDRYAALWQDLAVGHNVLTFGLGYEADVNGDWAPAQTGMHLTLRYQGQAQGVELALSGRHNALNALAAAAAGLAMGLNLLQVAAGLARVQAVPGRLQGQAGQHGSWLIDDSYNANPSSLQAALEVLTACPGRRFLVLGDMAELGDEARVLHGQMGAAARDAGIDGLFAVGPLSSAAVEEFGEGARAFAELPALIEALAGQLGPDVTVLVKGSRRMRMEQVVSALAERGEG